jgi:FtsP/CotA-like multicopper oxidase with cupredoxin domain
VRRYAVDRVGLHRSIWTAVFFAVVVAAPACQRREGALDAIGELRGSYIEGAPPTGRVVSYDLVAAETELPLVAGATADRKLKVWAYNGQVPGPEFRAKVGDTLRVRFTNRLPQSTTVHWHGVRVPNRMDGVPHATQPPIEPGETFVYEFPLKDAGTFWFHPHIRSSEQVERGLYGVLIVEDRVPPAYTRDVAWVLDDWLLDETGQLFPEFNTPHDLSHDGRWGNVLTVNGRTDTQLSLRPGERVRVRLLNASNGRVYRPDFAGVQARVIAFDGLYLRAPISAEGMELAPGNRVDLDVIAPKQAVNVDIIDRFVSRRPSVLARISVDGAPVRTPMFGSPARAAVPTWRKALDAPITKEYRLNARRGGSLGIEWTLNEVAFAGHEHAHHSSLSLAARQWARIRFTNESYRLHPIHIHGMFFKVVGRNGRFVDEPFFRDTVLVRGRETVDIGVVPVDEGSWMLHCHILEHAEAGMMTMIDVRAGTTGS